MDILHEPVENGDIAVDRDVDIVERLLIAEILLKVLHRRQEQRLIAPEILRALLRLVTHVDQHLVLHCCTRCHWDHRRIRACTVTDQFGGGLALVGPGLAWGAIGQGLLDHV